MATTCKKKILVQKNFRYFFFENKIEKVKTPKPPSSHYEYFFHESKPAGVTWGVGLQWEVYIRRKKEEKREKKYRENGGQIIYWVHLKKIFFFPLCGET